MVKINCIDHILPHQKISRTGADQNFIQEKLHISSVSINAVKSRLIILFWMFSNQESCFVSEKLKSITSTKRGYFSIVVPTFHLIFCTVNQYTIFWAAQRGLLIVLIPIFSL